MPEFDKPATTEQWLDNFEQIQPLMTATLAYNESARCLFCYDAPCRQACPTEIDIPLFIRQIYSGNVEGAAKTIYNSNWLGNICGKVCPTEVLCEGACVYNHENAKPIEIGRLQSYATTQVLHRNKKLYAPAPPKGKSVAVVGAGPAGLACACELSLLGYRVEVFEAKAQPSGLALHGVAPYKIENQTVLQEVEWLQEQFGFRIHYNQPINTAQDFARLQADYAAVFLGIGLGGTQPLGLEGEDLQGVWGATELIERLKMQPLDTPVGSRVVVIGGGNTAMDAASESARMGAASVTLVYRREKSDMSAYDFEYELAKSVGVKGLFQYAPLRIEGENGKVCALVLARTQTQADGKLQVIENEQIVLECDMLIKATGQQKQTELLQRIPGGLQLAPGGRIAVNADFQTSNPHFFAAGDAVNGGAEVVNAVAEAKKAARAIHRYLETKN